MLYLFSDFELDDRVSELRKNGQLLAIEPKPLRLLLDLVAHAPRVRSHDELLQALWADEVVTTASLTRAASALRRALGEAAGTPSLIETVRGRGYRMQAPVERVAPGSGGRAAPAAWQDMFVGRDVILSRLEELIARAEEGRGAIVLLAGEPGIGKTRTAEVVAERARSRGAEVYWGRASETPGAPPYSPWSQVLRAYLDAHPGRDPLPAERTRGNADLSLLIPEHRTASDPKPVPDSLTEEARFGLFESVTDFIRHASSEGPLVLVLDDLHWMAEPSLRLFSFLARQVGEMRLLILGTYRTHAASDGVPLQHILAELASLPHVEPALDLGGLTRSSVSTLLTAALGQKSAPAIVDSVYERTDGNPFFVRELTRQIVVGGGSATALAGPPASVRQVVASRASAFDASQRTILEAVAVIGREAPLSLLARVSELRAPEALDALAVLAAANLLELSGRTAPRARYAHAIAREALYEEMHPSRRIELHGAVADALVADSLLEPPLAEIAHHYLEAAPGRGIEPALRYVREASDEALRRLAAEEAVQLLERGLDVLELDPSHPPHSRCEILIALAASLDAVGRRRDARGRYVEAARVARLQGSPLHFAAAALGWTRHVPGYVVAGRREVEAISMLDEALDGLGDRDPSLRLELLAALLPKLYWAGEEGIARADRLSREAIEEARRQELPRLQALCLCRRHLLLWHPEGLEERLALAREAVGLADSETDPALTLEARFLRVVDRLEIGEVERALEDVDFYAQLAEETHQPNLVLQALSWRNAWAQAAGRVSETEQGIARGFELAQTARVPTARHALLVQQTLLDWTRDELSQLDPALEAVADAHESLDSWHALVAWLATEIGDTPLATAHLQALDKPDVLPLARSFDGVFVAAAKAIAAFRLGDVESAQRAYPELLPYAGRHVVGVFGTVLLGSASRYLGLLAATIGRYDEAERHFEEARAANWRTGAVLWAAHTLCDHAETLLSRGGPSDRPAAKRLLDEASDLADTSDLVGVTTRGQLLQRELDGITTLPRRPRVG